MSSSANHQHPSSAASSVSRWLSLHADMVQLVGWRLLAAGDQLLDYVRFRAVCRWWRSSTVSPHGRGVLDPRFHPRRWMLLPDGHRLHPAADGEKRLFNLSTGASLRIRLPLPADYRVLDSADGLLLVQWGKQDSAMIRLLHPFTGDFVELPPLMSLVRDQLKLSYGTRQQPQWVQFRSDTSTSVSAGGVVTVMIKISDVPHVFFATTKDQRWGVSTWSLTHYSRTISFQGKLYTLESPTIYGGEQQILQLDPPIHRYDEAMPPSLLPPKVIGTCPMDKISGQFSIAECDTEILLIGNPKTNSTNRSLLVYRVSDIVMDKVAPLTSIGGKTLFTTIDNNISSRDDDIHVFLRETMACHYKVIPHMPGDTIVRRRRLKDNTLVPYQVGTGNRSLTPTTCRCDDDGLRDCNCSLVYHIYDSCDCFYKDLREFQRMECEKLGLILREEIYT